MMRKFNSADAELVYINDNGETFPQLASDIVYSGTLIDPETGDDLDVDHVIIEEDNGKLIEASINDVFIVYVSESGEEYDQPVSDIVCSGTLIDPETGDDLNVDHVVYVQD